MTLLPCSFGRLRLPATANAQADRSIRVWNPEHLQEARRLVFALTALAIRLPRDCQDRKNPWIVGERRPEDLVPATESWSGTIGDDGAGLLEHPYVVADLRPSQRMKLVKDLGNATSPFLPMKDPQNLATRGLVECVLKPRLQDGDELIVQPPVGAYHCIAQCLLLCWLPKLIRPISDRCGSLEAPSRSYEGKVGQ